MPSAVGIAFDPEAVVDLGVVAFAEQRGVLPAGFAVVGVPLEDMMDVAPERRRPAAGEDAALVSQFDGLAQAGWVNRWRRP